MPADQETRIVEMRFDNRDFERNIKKSSKSLEDFKEELNFKETSKGLRDFTSSMNTIDFHGLTTNIQRLTDKFTGLGDAGEWVLSRIRNGIESAMISTENFLKSFTTAQISVGQGKYDALNKAVQALIATGQYTEKQAYDVFERVMEYTDQTSANFQTMVDQIATFTATGQGLWESEKAMEGIFNMTAKAGKGATEASAAMNVFSKAMGQGYLGLQQWQSLNQTAHIITADFRKQIIETAVATGDLIEKQGKYYTNSKKYGKQMQVTADNLETTLNKKWLSKNTMMAVFDKYYFAKLTGATEEELESFAGVAYKSAQRALTFADAMNAVKESVSSGWMESFRLIFGDVTEAMEFFTNLCERIIAGIEGIKEARNEILRVWSSSGGRSALIETILGDYGKSVKTGAYGLIDLFEDVGSVISEGFWEMTKIFARDDEAGLWEEEGYKEAWFGYKLKEFTKRIRDFVASIKNFFSEEVKVGDGTKTRLQLIGDIVAGIGASLVMAWDLVRGIGHFINGLREQLQPSIDAITNFFSQLGIVLYDTAEETHQAGTITAFFDQLLAVAKPLTDTINVLTNKIATMLLAFIKWGIESGTFAKVFDFLTRAFKKIGAIINRVAIPIITFFGDLATIFTDLFQSGFDPKQMSEIGAKIKAALSKMLSSILGVESLDKAGEELKKSFNAMINNVMESMPDSVKKVINAIKDLFGLWDNEAEGNSQSIFTKIRKFFEGGFGKVFGFLKNLFASFKEFNLATALKTGFGFGAAYNFINEIAGWFKGTNLYGVIMAFLGVATLWKLFSLISSVGKIGRNLGEAIDKVKDGLSIKLNLARQDDTSERLLKMAKSIALLVACVAVLGSLDTGSLLQGVISLGVIMGMMYLLDKLLKKDFASGSIGDQIGFAAQLIALGATITAITLALSVLMLAMVPLSKDPARMVTAIAGFTAIMAVLGGFIHLMLNDMIAMAKSISKDGKAGSKDFLKLGAIMIVLSASIAIMAAGLSTLMLALVPMAKVSWSGMLRAVSGLVIVLAAIGVFIHLMIKDLLKWATIAGNARKVKAGQIGAMLITFAASVVLLAIGISALITAMTPLALMSWEGWARAIGGLMLVMVALGAFMKTVVKMSSSNKKASVQIAGLASFAAGIGILMLALVPLSMMSWEGWIRAIAGLTLVMLALAGFIKIIQKLSKDNKALSVQIAGLAGFAAGIGLLMLSLMPLAMLKWEAWLRAIGGLILVMGALLLFIKLIQKMGANDKALSVKIAGLASLAFGIGILALAMIPLSTMSFQQMLQAIIGILGIMLALGLMVKAMEKVNIKMTKMLGLLILAGSLALLMNTLSPLANMTWEQLEKALIGMVAIMGVMVLFALGLSNMKAGLGGLVAMLGLVLVIVSISFALNEIKNIKTGVMLTFMAGLAALVLSMAGVIMVLSAIPLAAGVKAVLLLGVAIAAIAGVLSLVIPMLIGSVGSAMADFSAKLLLISSIIQEFSAKMNATDDSGIGKAEGTFDRLKSLVEKLAAFGDYKSVISNFTTALYDLGSGLSIYYSYVKDLPDPEGSNAFKMIDKIVPLASRLSAFTVGNFASEIYRLGVGLYAFDYLSADMGDPEQSKPLQLLKELAGCADDLKILTGLGLDQLKGQLAGLGGAMMLYAEGAKEVTGIEGDQAGNVEGAVGIMSAITKAFSEEGGFKLPDIPKEAELGTFGADLAALAGAVVKFADASTGLGSGTDKAIELLDFVGGELKQKLTADSLSAATSFKDAGITPYGLAEFALDIIGLAKAIGAFADHTKGIDEGKFNNAVRALGFFSELRGVLVGQDTILAVITAFTGDNVPTDQLTEFSKNIEQLGGALKNFATSVTWGEKEDASFQQAIDALQFLVDLKSRLPDIGGVKEFLLGRKQTLTDVASEIESLGVALNDFNKAIVGDSGSEKEGINTVKMTEALGVLDQVVDFLGNGEKGLQSRMGSVGGVLSWFTGKHYDATNLEQDMIGLNSVFGKLATLSNTLTGSNGETKIIDEATLTPALETLDSIAKFITDLQTRMPTIGGLKGVLDTFLNGEQYSTKNLKEDMGEIGAGIGAFASGIGSDFNPNSVNAAVGVVEIFARILQTLSSIGDGSYFDVSLYVDGLRELMIALNGGGSDGLLRQDVEGAAESVVALMSMISQAVEDYGNISSGDINMFTQTALALKHLTEIDPTFNFVVVGESIANGVATGITNTTSKVTEAARNMAIAAYNAAMNELRAASPSKLFQDVGGFITAGLSIGIDKGSGQVQNSIIDMSQDTLNNAMTVLGVISQMMSEDLDANPTITPVLDLTNLSSGIGTMNDLLGNRGMTINTGLASRLVASNIPTANRPEINQSTVDYSGIYERMAALGETVAALGDQIAQMKIVLDSGAIAGAVTDAVDDAIGAKTFYAGRGN